MEATAGQKRKERKKRYKEKFERALQQYKNVLVVTVDNVGSLQLQKIRIALRGVAEIVMGKNTLMRMIMREQMVANPKLESLLGYVKGNMGLIFTNGDLAKIRTIVTSNKVPAAAKSGTLAPSDVFVPAGPTGLDPGQTSFFQALNIATKIARGSIEIVANVHLIKHGEKVTSSHVALLGKLDIKPFFYGIIVTNVYESGSMYPAAILDITPDQLLAKFFGGVRRIAAIGLAVGYPTEASIPIRSRMVSAVCWRSPNRRVLSSPSRRRFSPVRQSSLPLLRRRRKRRVKNPRRQRRLRRNPLRTTMMVEGPVDLGLFGDDG